FSNIRRDHPKPILFPYTTLFRSKTTQWEETAEIFERILAAEKNLHSNLDWPAGRLYHSMGLEVPLYTPIFVMSRVTGWSAHVIEDRKSTRLNSSHQIISYAVFCL